MDAQGQRPFLQVNYCLLANAHRKEEGRRTINRMFTDNLHHADDSWDFAVGMVEERIVSLLHGLQVVSGCISINIQSAFSVIKTRHTRMVSDTWAMH